MTDNDVVTGAPAIQIQAELQPRFDEILTADALDFIAELTRRFGPRRLELLQARADRYAAGDPGHHLAFRDDTAKIRNDPSWRVAPPAPGLEDRRAEMTGPTTRKMVINALNSGAKAWMADFEDATSPSWFNVVDGQINLYDAIRRQIDFTDDKGKRYEVGETTPTIMVRPRGWHLDERHLTLDGVPLPGAFVDFGLYFFHNAQTLITNGAGPYFYLPKMESHLEARLWNDVFSYAEERLEIPYGTIRATCLIETTPAAFEMEEILYELRDHSSGLNAGRWDYIFSMIKNFAEDQDHLLPDRSAVTMTSPFMAAYANLLVKTCHARGAHAIGGHGRVRAQPEQSRSDDGGAGEDDGRQVARGRSRVRRILGRPPGAGRNLHDRLHRGARRPAQPVGEAARRRHRRGRGPHRRQHDARLADGGRSPDQHPGQPRVPGGLGRWRGCGGDRQPDGGRRHGGDLPDAGLAVRPAQCDRTPTER